MYVEYFYITSTCLPPCQIMIPPNQKISYAASTLVASTLFGYLVVWLFGFWLFGCLVVWLVVVSLHCILSSHQPIALPHHVVLHRIITSCHHILSCHHVSLSCLFLYLLVIALHRVMSHLCLLSCRLLCPFGCCIVVLHHLHLYIAFAGHCIRLLHPHVCLIIVLHCLIASLHCVSLS